MVVAQQGQQVEYLDDSASVHGTVDRILYAGKGSWGLILLHVDRHDPLYKHKQEIKVKGHVMPITPQCEVRINGKWVPDDRNPGEEIFDATECFIEQPTTRKGLIAKLAELPYVGKQRASVIVEVFGEDLDNLLKILREDPDRVAARIPGLSPERALLVAESVARSGWGSFLKRDVELLRILPPWIKNRAMRLWPGPPTTEKSALDILHENPYDLIQIKGVGFKRADKAALDLGIPVTDPRRADAALWHVLEIASQQDGHTWISLDQCAHWAQQEKLEGIAKRQLREAIDRGVVSGDIYATVDYGVVTSRAMAENEELIAAIATIQAQETRPECILDIVSDMGLQIAERGYDSNDREQVLKAWIDCISDEYSLNEQQREAVRLALTRRFLILTGGPGTGKTYTLQAILRALKWEVAPDHFGDAPVRLCAPTGKAARRMAEVTGKDAQTIHQLLRYNFDLDAFEYGSSNSLPARLVVCDEASMLHANLAAALFGAIDSKCRLILVGDVDQLPSVGAGNVLSDLIESGSVPVIRLEQVMRQADDSAIAKNAHALIQGKEIALDNSTYADFKFFEIQEQEIKREERLATGQTLVQVHQAVRDRFGHGLQDVQVLSPQKAGEIGVKALNIELRKMCNPSRPEAKEIDVKGQKRSLREGDRVIQTKNDYDLQVMNGQLGTIIEIEPPDPEQKNKRGAALVQMEDGNLVRYPAGALGNLHLSYAITIHKSQGSEWPVVIIPVSKSHARMLSRRLLYTAITRARKLVVLVGTQSAIKWARKNVRDAQRQTRLLNLLRPQGDE